ncbi:hypothetical protein LP421_33105 (plasmid) [Rhizobium sp. RCAM05350]|nr:hypothetical protein LP421_33105 [Rhizobium sp. RCAM05350]
MPDAIHSNQMEQHAERCDQDTKREISASPAIIADDPVNDRQADEGGQA